jgi:hypothetical protein
MKWEPADILRLTALVGGFLMCALGGWLMWLGVGAEGTVDIRTSVLSGSVKIGSAGLFLIFFGFGIVIFVLATIAAKSSAAHLTSSQRESSSRLIGKAFWGVLVSFLLMVVLASVAGNGSPFGAAAFFLGCFLFLTGIAYVAFLSSE